MDLVRRVKMLEIALRQEREGKMQTPKSQDSVGLYDMPAACGTCLVVSIAGSQAPSHTPFGISLKL
jgi:hypothetical protein